LGPWREITDVAGVDIVEQVLDRPEARAGQARKQSKCTAQKLQSAAARHRRAGTGGNAVTVQACTVQAWCTHGASMVHA
jgi:hypothetical protein